MTIYFSDHRPGLLIERSDSRYSLQVNVIATLLLAELVLPVLQRTAKSVLPGVPKQPRLVINTSFTHNLVGELRGFENGTMIACANEMKATDKWDPDSYARGKSV